MRYLPARNNPYWYHSSSPLSSPRCGRSNAAVPRSIWREFPPVQSHSSRVRQRQRSKSLRILQNPTRKTPLPDTHTHTHKFPVSIERTSKNPWLNPQEDCQSLASKWKTANGYRCGGAVPDERRHTQSHLQNPLESNNLTIELTKDVPPQ